MFQDSLVVRSIRILSRSDRRKVVAVILIQILFGLLDLIGVALVGILGALAVTGVQSKAPGNRVSQVLEFLQIENQDLQTQASVIGLLAATFLIIKTIFSVVFVRKTIFFLARRSAAISANLISKVLAQPLISVQSRSMQQTLYMVTVGVDSITMGVLNTIVLVISDVSLLLILGTGLFVVDPTVALSTFAAFSAIAYLLYRLLQVRAVELGERERVISIKTSERILEVLNSYREIVVRNRRSFYSRELSRLRYDLASINAEGAFMPNISKYVVEITVVIVSLAIAAIQFSVNDASHAIAVLSVFMAASTRISPAILRLQQSSIRIKTNMGSASPTLILIEELESYRNIPSLVDELNFEHIGFSGEILLEDVCLTYPTKNTPALNQITLDIKSGEVVSFVGPSGAGKTSVVDVILGVLQPDSGKVLMQGIDPLEAIKKWPGAIGYVPQDVMISNGSIRENVCLGYESLLIQDKLIWDALETAQLSEFVRSLPQGLDSQVGDRGTNLSGGQRQRLGIARAMFTKPKLLVLDEATSALDGTTEANISDAIHNLKGKVTIVIIAHRLSTVVESDMIHYMNDGRIEKSGSFHDLRNSIPAFDEQAQLLGF